MNIVDYLKKLYTKFEFFFFQRTDKNGVTYLWKRRRSKSLIIIFSGIGHAPFNYVKTLSNVPYDQLFIKDSWSNGVSYYWFDRLTRQPEDNTQSLINRIIIKGGYSTIYTVGSSKGGTAAIYFGLKNNVDVIIAGACQYYIGSYLAYHQYETHPEQWQDMVGEVKPRVEIIQYLDKKLANMIKDNSGSKTIIHLLYSTEEHTYPEHIIPLIKKLDECNISHEDYIEKFGSHSMIGIYFRDLLKDYFSSKK